MDLTINNFDFVQVKNEFLIPGTEICRRLGYKFPREQAGKIWGKHENVLYKYSVVAKLVSTDLKKYDTRVYNELGAYFFIAKCNKPLADQITEEMMLAFIQLRDESVLRGDSRAKGIEMYKGLTDQLKLLKEDESNEAHRFIYSNIARNNCKTITGLSPKQLKEQRNVKIARDGLTLQESVKLSALELYQAEYLKDKTLSTKEAYADLKKLSNRFINTLKRIE